MKTHKAIFFDGGKRWRRIKKITGVFVLLVVGIFCIIAYAFLYSPFESTLSPSGKQSIDATIEYINETSRPAVGQGTFLTIKNIYGKKYISRFGEEKKLVILTFDDGPSPTFTPQILSILKKEKIKGTFFIVGKQLYKHPELGKRILKEGSDIGLHTFSHNGNARDVHLSPFTFIRELDFTEKLFAYQYGFKTLLFRIPYLAMEDLLSYNSLQYVGEAYKRGLTISTPTVDSQDWATTDPKKVIKLATTSDVQTVVILFHDAGGERSATLKALPDVIQFYRERGYHFATISEYASSRGLPVAKQLTPQDKFFVPIAYNTYNAIRESPKLATRGFLIGFLFVLLHTSVFVCLAVSNVILRKRSKEKRPKKDFFVSIIIPMYNEERAIYGTLKSVLRSSYKNIEVLLVDDGSTDRSVLKIRRLASDHRLKLLSKENGGKCTALNFGLKHAVGEIIVCIDADTRLTKSAIERLVRCFYDRKVGAVAGMIKVGNKKTLIAKLQSAEYAINQSIEKAATDIFSSILVVPGAIGAWRKTAIRRAGLFSEDTIAEDFDLTVSIIRKGYAVKFCDKAVAYTEAPHLLKDLYTQRFRWNFGNLQVFYKHRDMVFKKKYKMFGLLFLPRSIFIQIPTILLTPFIDLFILLNLFTGGRGITLFFFSLYMLTQLIVGAVAYFLARQSLKEVLFVPFLRFPYAQILSVIFYITFLTALKGEIIRWGKLNHTGKLTVAIE